MRMGVGLCRIPDPEGVPRLGAGGTELRTDGLARIVNPADECALEIALRLKASAEEAGRGGEVIAFALDETLPEELLRKALALGADRAVHVVHSTQDPERTSRRLAERCRAESLDLLLVGSQSADYGCGVVGSFVAVELDWPAACLVTEALGSDPVASGLEEDRPRGARVGASSGLGLVVTREIGGGRLERLRLPLPAVVAVQEGANRPRYPTLRGILSAKSKALESVSGDGASDSSTSSGTSSLVIEDLWEPPASTSSFRVEGGVEQASRELVRHLTSLGALD